MKRRLIALAAACAVEACTPAGNSTTGERGTVHKAEPMPARFAVGRTATPAEVAAWNIDVNAKGEGLPPGKGDATAGAAVYAAQCASCHGAKGEGMPPNPKLVGREPRDFSFATTTTAVKTVGNYWPYATTLYDYIRRAMPQLAPGTMTPDETYAVIAWILAENEVIPRDKVMDATSLPAVVMPARDRFVPDDRAGGKGFR
ncbi:MAG: cytochrome c [Cytophagaceae bacterium]|nr:cytochrome c [Gemmatimonadaceae bacterium]